MHSFSLLPPFLLLAVFGATHAHPAFQHQFNNIVDANPCLKKCVDTATEEDIELSILKTANVTSYLLNIGHICNIISTARECIVGCKIESNPFSLESMTAICSPKAQTDIKLLDRCLNEHGNAAFDQCQSTCGDHDVVTGQAHEKTKAFRPETNDPEKVADIMADVNAACGILKCSNRCFVQTLSTKCAPLENGLNAGLAVRYVLERVMVAQRHDLERMQLVDLMANSVPAQCNYLYMPEVMFNITRDELALSVIHQTALKTEEQKQIVKPPRVEENPNKNLNLALSQIHAQLLQRQMNLLDIQESNLRRESQKLDMELELLMEKRRQRGQPTSEIPK